MDGGAVDAWLVELRDGLADQDGFVGLWIHGSAATPEWVHGVSDVDLLIAWERPPPSGARTRLIELVQRSVDVSPTETDILLVTVLEAANPPPVPTFEVYAMRHPRDGPPSVSGPGTDASLLFDFESARSQGITVAGQAPAAVFGAAPREWLLDAADHELATWQAYHVFRRPDMAVLQAARVSLLSREDRLASKLAAGRWARDHWPPSVALEAAIACQLGDTTAVVDEVEARALIARTRDEIAWHRSRTP